MKLLKEYSLEIDNKISLLEEKIKNNEIGPEISLIISDVSDNIRNFIDLTLSNFSSFGNSVDGLSHFLRNNFNPFVITLTGINFYSQNEGAIPDFLKNSFTDSVLRSRNIVFDTLNSFDIENKDAFMAFCNEQSRINHSLDMGDLVSMFNSGLNIVA